MKTWLILKHITVENANSISGITYGFPSITHFLGYTHKVGRIIAQDYPKLKIGGCGVISHKFSNQTISNQFREQIFILKRHPLVGTKGESASEIQEGRIHLDVSLVVECYFDDRFLKSSGFMIAWRNRSARCYEFEKYIKSIASQCHLAGGVITEIGDVLWTSQEDSQLRRLVPGFALTSAHQEFANLIAMNKENGIIQDNLQTLLDCLAIKWQYSEKENDSGQWNILDRPIKGWCVPITIGNRGISEVFKSGITKGIRDIQTPFRYVEPVYSLGRWINPLLAKSLDNLIWNYSYNDPYYICVNKF